MRRCGWPCTGCGGRCSATSAISGAFQLLQLVAVLDQRWLGLAAFALNVLIGFEADTLRRWGLERRGWHTIGTVSGKTADECERRFFDGWLPNQPILAASAQSPPATGGGWRLLGARS